MVAICPDSPEVIIYKKTPNGFEKAYELKEHDHVVTGIDWGVQKNRLVTCSQDRNAYVWNFSDGNWKPTLVILRINRAATAVKWSPNEEKFAVASGAKVVSICYFEQDNDWWVSKHIKKHKSTVLSLAWHPNNVYIATGSADFKSRIFSGFIKGLDDRPPEGPFGNKLMFGQVLAEYAANGWVHDVAWSPSGNTLAFTSHDAVTSFVDINSGNISRISSKNLPFRSILFLNETQLVAAGHDCNPILFANQGGWKQVKEFDEGKKQQGPALSNAAKTRGIWADKVDKGTDSSILTETTLKTKHQNAISCIQITAGTRDKVAEFSTTAVDGQLIFWKA